MTSHDGYDLFVIQQDVRNLIFQTINYINNTAEAGSIDYFEVESPGKYLNLNPLYYRTVQGLFLEYLDGRPHSIWSPLGAWTLGFVWRVNPEAEAEFHKQLTEVLGLELFQERLDNGFGPIYGITRTEDSGSVPRPVYGDVSPNNKIQETINKSNFEYINMIWRNMVRRYLLESGQNLSLEFM